MYCPEANWTKSVKEELWMLWGKCYRYVISSDAWDETFGFSHLARLLSLIVILVQMLWWQEWSQSGIWLRMDGKKENNGTRGIGGKVYKQCFQGGVLKKRVKKWWDGHRSWVKQGQERLFFFFKLEGTRVYFYADGSDQIEQKIVIMKEKVTVSWTVPLIVLKNTWRDWLKLRAWRDGFSKIWKKFWA